MGFSILFYYVPIKGYGLDPYFRSAAALSGAPPPLPVHLVACEGLAGGSGKFRECLSLLSKNTRNFGNLPDLKKSGNFRDLPGSGFQGFTV